MLLFLHNGDVQGEVNLLFLMSFPTDETEVICTLFRYWITEVLPMHTEKMT